jgi:uracil-DNA glycosylase family 4
VSEYDPVANGALCHRCPLQGSTVVPPETHNGALFWCVSEAPGAKEVTLGYPLKGASGAEHDRAMRAAGLRRNAACYTNAFL